MLTGLLASLIEWALSKGLVALESFLGKWYVGYKAKQQETADAKQVAADAAKGDENALAKDAGNLLDS
jgi:hypothetical protein